MEQGDLAVVRKGYADGEKGRRGIGSLIGTKWTNSAKRCSRGCRSGASRRRRWGRRSWDAAGTGP